MADPACRGQGRPSSPGLLLPLRTSVFELAFLASLSVLVPLKPGGPAQCERHSPTLTVNRLACRRQWAAVRTQNSLRMVPPQKPSFSSLTSRACDGRARGARWSLTLRPLAQASSPSPHHSGPAPREDSWGLRAGTRTRPAQPHAHPQGPCCPAPPVLGAGPPWTPRPCRGPSATAEGLLPTQIQPLPVCISRLRKAPQQLYVQKNCCLSSLV